MKARWAPGRWLGALTNRKLETGAQYLPMHLLNTFSQASRPGRTPFRHFGSPTLGRSTGAVVADRGCVHAGAVCLSRGQWLRRVFCLLLGGLIIAHDLLAAPLPAASMDSLPAWSERFSREVDRRLDVPPTEQQRYIVLLQQALSEAGQAELPAQTFVLVDRNPQVQAAMLIIRTPAGGWHWLGATAVSTGKTGTFEHFLTPLGVFAHTLENPDFRSLGTFNKNHIRGYGLRGRRVFDFGWQLAERGWGNGGMSKMRLQMHATDPRVLASRLGRVASEGCIRIPATLNVFLDIHGVLDADYETAAASGERLWVLKPQRQPIPWAGRYLVIVDSQAGERPLWSPLPGVKPAQPRNAKLSVQGAEKSQ